eukprot:TRINITY_DN3137_c0_g1_i2.p1 TRINITY_DN3137_c0_g1~~TRINITY_DN3137_c0_g1_i2.p1  ORF type:complete len:149 (-),score=7.45 TRINITY_DN3137_c0_g1_i2:66-512(-)
MPALPLTADDMYYADEDYGRSLHRNLPDAFETSTRSFSLFGPEHDPRLPHKTRYFQDVPYLTRGFSMVHGYNNYVDGTPLPKERPHAWRDELRCLGDYSFCDRGLTDYPEQAPPSFRPVPTSPRGITGVPRDPFFPTGGYPTVGQRSR